jgi:hypothetical protein
VSHDLGTLHGEHDLVDVQREAGRLRLGCFDDETCRLEPIENPFAPKLLPMSPERSVTHVSGIEPLAMASPTFAIWNQLNGWLRAVDCLRRAA